MALVNVRLPVGQESFNMGYQLSEVLVLRVREQTLLKRTERVRNGFLKQRAVFVRVFGYAGGFFTLTYSPAQHHDGTLMVNKRSILANEYVPQRNQNLILYLVVMRVSVIVIHANLTADQ